MAEMLDTSRSGGCARITVAATYTGSDRQHRLRRALRRWQELGGARTAHPHDDSTGQWTVMASYSPDGDLGPAAASRQAMRWFADDVARCGLIGATAIVPLNPEDRMLTVAGEPSGGGLRDSGAGRPGAALERPEDLLLEPGRE